MSSQEVSILIRNNYSPTFHPIRSNLGNLNLIEERAESADSAAISTVMMNLSYYGYALDANALRMLCEFNSKALASWWTVVEAELRAITGDDRNIGDFVVYKNFPAECLSKSDAEYWHAQILMYWGMSKEFFTEEVEPREKMAEQPKLKVLRQANANTLANILNSLIAQPARWKEQELNDACFLAETNNIDFTKFGFKENLVNLATDCIKKGQNIVVNTATDVLRLAVGMSGGDPALREKSKFISFSRKTRRAFLRMLNNCKNIEEDMARRPELWKRFVHQIHPFDYKELANVCEAANFLYNDKLITFNSKVERLISIKDPKTLSLLATRPGEFRRRLVHMLEIFEEETVQAFVPVLSKLTTMQLVSLRKMLETHNSRKTRTYPPKGNWSRLQIKENKREINYSYIKSISEAIGEELKLRLQSVRLDDATDMVKLPSNDGEVSPYNRGTIFPIPQEVNFIRTASYWKVMSRQTVWFDNGWNFFDKNWKSMHTCCWSSYYQKVLDGGAVFSGDPVSSGEMQGRAAQMIDLNLPELKRAGVRYAVWNILCFNKIPFSKADEVYAALQWGTDAQSGKLFEPSRCQLSFPLKGESLTKYICYLDLEKNQMVYMDANLKGNVHSATSNASVLEEQMPAYVEYLNSLPSVYDLFEQSHSEESNVQVLYSDDGVSLNSDDAAYVFKPENKANSYEVLDLNALLSATG